MTFKQSILTCLGPKYLFKFSGRASRSEYWWFALFIILANIASSFFWLFPPNVAATLNFILGLLLLPASMGVTVRRLHDRNLSGWWLLVPLFLLVTVVLAGPAAQNAILDLLSFGLTLIFIIILCMPGYPGANKYGENPLAEYKKIPN